MLSVELLRSATKTMLRPALISLAAFTSLVLGGCSGANLPSLPALPQLTGTVTEAPIVGAPTEVYERIARGIMTCWFGTSGPLKANYVYHAEAEPAGKGGKAEIIIHERDRVSDNPKGLRAYRIAIMPDGETTTLLFENFKLPEPKANSMEADARRWGAGAFGCADMDAGGWSENKPEPPEPAKDGKKKRQPKKDPTKD
jgi:hypothetical protein